MDGTATISLDTLDELREKAEEARCNSRGGGQQREDPEIHC